VLVLRLAANVRFAAGELDLTLLVELRATSSLVSKIFWSGMDLVYTCFPSNKILQKLLTAGVSPETPLGQLTAIPQTP